MKDFITIAAFNLSLKKCSSEINFRKMKTLFIIYINPFASISFSIIKLKIHSNNREVVQTIVNNQKGIKSIFIFSEI